MTRSDPVNHEIPHQNHHGNKLHVGTEGLGSRNLELDFSGRDRGVCESQLYTGDARDKHIHHRSGCCATPVGSTNQS